MESARASSSPETLSGGLLGGKYRVRGLLGRGATGQVYLAIQEPIGRAVAVKVLRPDLSPDDQRQFEVRFLREASQAGALQHPNVVTVHDFGRTDDGTCYLVMELLRGRSLKDLLREGPLEPIRALDIFIQVVKGLRAAHAAGLVHRDVKPGNVFLLEGEDGADFIKILDFGLVKDVSGDSPDLGSVDAPTEEDAVIEDAEESAVTRHGAFLGTPHYIPPEQARAAAVDHRADLYSAGVVLYRMLTGVLPYTARTASALAVAHVRNPYPAMSERAPEVAVPPSIEAIVRRCMAKAPDDRYPNADALLVDLRRARRELSPTDGPPPGDSLSLSHPLAADMLELDADPPARARVPLWAVAVGGVLGLGAILGAVVAWQVSVAPVEPLEPVAPVEVAAPVRSVSLLVSSDPSGAAVILDGDVLGVTPLARAVELPADEADATRTFVLRKDGYEAATLTLDLSGEQVAGNVALTAEPPAPEPQNPTPRARVASQSGAAQDAPRAPVEAGSSKGSGSASNGGAAGDQAATTPAGAVYADGVFFTTEEAAAAKRWLNEADEAAVRGAGIAGRQVNILLEGRPWASVSAFADTPWIGEKTLESVRSASRR